MHRRLLATWTRHGMLWVMVSLMVMLVSAPVLGSEDEVWSVSLIVRSHDFLGECEAATTQRVEYSTLYKEHEAPLLQRCASSGTILMECPAGRAGLKVMVEGSARGVCGKGVIVPVGHHEVSVPEVSYEVGVEVQASVMHRHSIGRASKKGARAHVSKLLSTADHYAIFMTPDGLHQIWVLNDQPDLLHPYEGRRCTRSESRGEDTCTPLTKTQRDELEKVAPMILMLPD